MRTYKKLKYKDHLKYLSETRNKYPSPVYLILDENDKPYYKRLYKSKHANSVSSYFKRYSNKKVRRYKNPISSGNTYRKIFDYWYEII
jgi:hypothetical protein